ncbi:MAG: hypothetical protein ACLT8E_01385 [Akkermansia sp.]
MKEEWGRLDILVNGAGGNDPRGTSPAEQCMPDTWRIKASSAWTWRALST